MKKSTKKTSRKRKRRRRINRIGLICWIIVPLAILTMLVLDGFGLYLFNTERLIVIGACILVLLIPFFSEITVTNVSIKKEKDSK
jgi:hypothetical protein